MKRVLFIMSNDFGELGLAILFARKQDFIPYFVIPKRLHQFFDEPGIESSPYETLNDIYIKISQFNPDVVMFFSAYLITINELATSNELSRLIEYIREKKCKIITSDPFVRIYDHFPDIRFMNELFQARYEEEENEIKKLNCFLDGMCHLYNHAYVSNNVKSYGFFNKNYTNFILKKESSVKIWTLVISMIEVRVQFHIYGPGFVSLVENQITRILSNLDNRVNLIAPRKFLDMFSGSLRKSGSFRSIEFCTTSEFEEQIKCSDVVFYWNVFSNSILLCWHYNVPVLFLDIGHVGQLSPDLYDHVLKHTYHESTPDFFDFEVCIDSDLDKLLGDFYSFSGRQSIMTHQKTLVTPTEIIKDVLK